MPSGTWVILAPGDVRPGHMMLAPLRMKRIAPLSTCILGAMNGSERREEKSVCRQLCMEGRLKKVIITLIVVN